MPQKIILWLALILLLPLVLPASALSASPVQTWQLTMTEADSAQSVGENGHAIRLFTGATTLAEKQKLPAKYVAIPLCGVIEEEVLCSQIEPAEANFQKFISLIKAQSQVLLPDPQVNGRINSLADTYQDHQNPKTRETCLKNACLLKMLLFGDADQHCTDCMSVLANYYIEHGKIDEGVQIMTTVEKAKAEKSGKIFNITAVGDLLNLMAVNYRGKHQYDISNQIELVVINLANTSHSSLSAGLPAFYTFLGMNAMAQGKDAEGRAYFTKALKQCPKVKVSKNRQCARPYLDLLVQTALSDNQKTKQALQETELRQLLALAQAISSDLRWQYGAITILAANLNRPGKREESENYLKQAIAIAKLPNSYVAEDIADLYMRIALSLAHRGKMGKANEVFVDALKAEKDKRGFHSTLVFLFWGCMLVNNDQFPFASDKFNIALKMASALPPQNRGTLLADTLVCLADLENRYSKAEKAQSFLQQSSTEIQLQKKLNSKLGPDFLHRL